MPPAEPSRNTTSSNGTDAGNPDTAPNPETLPTLAEEDAPADIRELFADLRGVLKVPVAPLAWRHLATLPGALPWCWSTLRPIYLSGAIDRAAARLMAAAHMPGLPRLTPPTLAAVGIGADELGTLALTLETFHRSNPMNLVALSVLLSGLHAPGGSGDPEPAAPWSAGGAARPPAEMAQIPPMLAMDAMTPEATALAWELTRMGGPGAPEALPSVWRILARWPGYLALAVTLLAPLESNGWLPGARENLQERLGDVARDLLGDNPVTAPNLPKTDKAALDNALRRFTGSVITRIIPKIAILRGTLPENG